MTASVNRRDFLRLAGLLPLSLAAPRWASSLSAPSSQKNVIVVVFDAFSALNISLYGYPRETTPNLRRLAQRAIVYHNHYAASNFTTSGTASLLTGTLPWTHRALLPNGKVTEHFLHRNIFRALPDYYRLAYTHNSWAFTLLNQFWQDIDELVLPRRLFLASIDNSIGVLFRNDGDLSSLSWTRDTDITSGYAYSLLLSHLLTPIQERQIASVADHFPRGLPTSFDDRTGFLLEDAIAWLRDRLGSLPQPFFGYLHFLPPHSPYRTSSEFYRRFAHDGFRPMDKPLDVFATKGTSPETLALRTSYDEYILYVDQSLGVFFDFLKVSGLLDTTWVVLTTDHGEMFERGMAGHGNPSLYQPLIRVPLMIFEPGRQVGQQVQIPTSALDLLPTLAHITGHSIPDWAEGQILPPFAEANAERSIYAVLARKNDPSAPLTIASTALIRANYKLLYYFGYRSPDVKELTKLYDVMADAEEMIDLSASRQDVTQQMLNELKAMITRVNKPYV
ncbi:MAG TPA: sulfatase-like hydrolase/transferase [Anaerolineales bacterium]|nr:sulfatase-like hydrolase/transferase [Anaerolineales bacterium]